MYIPRHWHFAIPFGAIMATFGINQQILGGGFHWDYFVTVQLPVAMSAYQYAYFLSKAGVAYQNYQTGAPKVEQPQEILDWNTGRVVAIKTGGVQVGAISLNQTTVMPRLNAERKFAKTLIDMRNGNLEVKLTESHWISPVNRYGEERDKFVEMKERWVRNGVLGRAGVGKTAPYIVADWRQVRLVAQGEPLPRQ
jgi:hypothetical protein